MFTQRFKGLPGRAGVSLRNEKTGWYIQKDVLGDKSHGGSAYKLFDQFGNRVATLDEHGFVLRE